MTPRATIDYETRSACSIRSCGSWRYSLDPATSILCLAFRLPHWVEGRTGLWHPAFPEFDMDEAELGSFDDLFELFEWIANGGLIEAHNGWFERGIWTNIAVPRYGWPAIPHRSWRCSAAKAAAHSLPRKLGDAADALQLEIRKDDEGAVLMKKMVKPRKPLMSERRAWGVKHAACTVCKGKGKVDGINPATGRKKLQECGKCDGRGFDVRVPLPDMPILYHESRELLERLFVYCQIDVLAEEGVSHALPDLSDEETEMYLLDQAVNERGFRLDEEAIDAALELVDQESADLHAQIADLTGGAVTKVSQRAKLLAWFGENGLDLPDTTADTIDGLLEPASREVRTDITDVCWRGLELLQAGSKSSTAKYVKMRDWVCPDGRVHGGLLYHGASTGRWTGAGIQPHNFPRGSVKDQDELWFVLKSLDREVIVDLAPRDKTGEPLYADVMDALSNALRGVIVPAEGKQLYVADYAAIECRVLLWVAGDEDGLDIFRQGRDIYNEMASDIYRRPIDRKVQEVEGALGKVAILGLGYQMGPGKFVETAQVMGGVTIIEDLFCEHKGCGKPSRKHRYAGHDFKHAAPETMTAVKVVDAYRTKFWRVKNLWGDQEAAAIKAVKTGRRIECGQVAWFVEGAFLYCELPSGRRLAYPEPRVIKRLMPWGDEKPCLTYMGVNAYTRQWSRQNSYGGLLVENIVQAIARDLMADAMLRCERSGVYTPVLSVHDEMIAEADLGAGSVAEFEELMAECSVWAAGCPVEAKGWSGLRYRK